MDISELLTKFILKNFSDNLNRPTIDPEDDLLEQGIIDSLGVMGLIAFMEEEFKITVNDEEIVPENFQTVNSMKTFLERKLNDASPC